MDNFNDVRKVVEEIEKKTEKKYYEGCLVGGAIGDALGWPVEFMRFEEIVKVYGKQGITHLVLCEDGKAQITDDTQMTMFTVEGLLRGESRQRHKGICHVPTVIYFAYMRWLKTQGYPEKEGMAFIYDSWLLDVDRMNVQRAPGNACITSLISGKKGTIDEPINNSKGCGTVMRSAPFGLFLKDDAIFAITAETAALTHGHPTGQIAAVALAYLIREIQNGQDIKRGLLKVIEKLKDVDDALESVNKLEQALYLSTIGIDDLEAIQQIGEGWIAEEALGISVYCCLKYQNNFRKAVITAVNHSGDSDSTGSITGNILGAFLGIEGIPKDWVNQIELLEELLELAGDLYDVNQGEYKSFSKYPGC